MKYKRIDDAIKRLEELSELEGSELGESWDKLIYINNYSYCFSKEFNKAVEKEIFEQAQDSHKNFEIVEEEIIPVQNSYKRKVLKQKS